MNEAATQDVREMTLEPVLSKLLRGGSRAELPRDAQMLALLDAWHRQGGSRLDRTGNGKITAPGAAIMDTAWPLLAQRVGLGGARAGASAKRKIANTGEHLRPAAAGGQYPAGTSTCTRTCARCCGMRVRGKYAIRYCGAGNLRRCRPLLWGAIDQAGSISWRDKQGPRPGSNWRSSATAEQIGSCRGS